MHSIEFDKSIIKGVKLINVEKIIPHEQIIEKKADKLIKYIESFNNENASQNKNLNTYKE